MVIKVRALDITNSFDFSIRFLCKLQIRKILWYILAMHSCTTWILYNKVLMLSKYWSKSPFKINKEAIPTEKMKTALSVTSLLKFSQEADKTSFRSRNAVESFLLLL